MLDDLEVHAAVVARALGEHARRAQGEVAVVAWHTVDVDAAADRDREVPGRFCPDVLVQRHRLIRRGDVVIAVVLHTPDLEEEVDLSGRPDMDAIGGGEVAHSSAEDAQMLTSMPSESASICSSSSVVKAGPLSAARFSSSCAVEEAPISAEATTGSRSTHWMASWASVCPRPLATTSSPRRCARPVSDTVCCGSEERCCARCAVPSPRYFPVSRPWASGVNAMAPIPSCFSTPVRPSSTQRLRIEYEGWWITSGVPRLRATAAATAVRSAL